MTSSVSGLSSYFTSLISDLMAIERQPLTRIQSQRDSLNVQRSIYTDAKGRLDSLQDAVQALMSTSLSPALRSGRKAAVSNVAAGATVLTASVGSSAIAGTYQIQVNQLAREHRVRSDQQLYADQALNLSGTILLGGAAARSAGSVVTLGSTVTALAAAAPAGGQRELGSSSYYVETRNDPTLGWQFRLVDGEGNAVNILKSGDTTLTSEWQAIPTGGGLYDTGRGLQITFGADSAGYVEGRRGDLANPAASLSYTAQGASLSVAATDSLNAIAAKINSAIYADGNGVVATVVDRQLILASAKTGASYGVVASDASGTVLQSLGVLTGAGAFKNLVQTARNAEMVINNLTVIRSQNTGLSNVISGVTLNLAADAEGKSATLNVSVDWSGARSAVDTFVEKFNALTDYIEDKTGVSSNFNGTTTTYTRGALADDTIFSELRSTMFSSFIGSFTNSGIHKSLREVGLTIDDNLDVSVSDPAKLEAALNNNLDSVKALMDQAMGALDAAVGRFTGQRLGAVDASGYLATALGSVDDQINEMNGDIADMQVRLGEREAYLTQQYAEMQAQLMSLAYAQQSWSSIYGSVNSLY